jgi:hypothetical protein
MSAGVQLAAIGVTTTGVFLLQNGSHPSLVSNKGTNLYGATLPA